MLITMLLLLWGLELSKRSKTTATKIRNIGCRLVLGNQRFPVRVQLLAMWRGKPSAGIAWQYLSVCEVLEVVKRTQRNCLPFPLLSCEIVNV